MTEPTLEDFVELASKRVGPPRKVERGYQWVCYCPVCSELRKLSKPPEPEWQQEDLAL